MALYNLNLLPPEDIMQTSKEAHMEAKLVAQSNEDYTVKQVRNIIISTEEADVNKMENGDIWITI